MNDYLVIDNSGEQMDAEVTPSVYQNVNDYSSVAMCKPSGN